jgi:hypothetical protein
MWRCPHCGTPQAEAARCWVCRRSSTSCGTCRHFRRAVAANLGYCGLDRTRTPLAGDELRGCWQESDIAPGSVPTPAGSAPAAGSTARGANAPVPPFAASMARRLDFIEVGVPPDGRRAPRRRTAPEPDTGEPILPTPPAAAPEEPRWSLWGEPDR